MPLFTWSDKYSIGNDEIDNQHKKLFDILNKLFDICVGKNDVDTLEAALDDLVSYTDYHFKFEEQHMRDVGYKKIGKHIVEHDYFKNEIIFAKRRQAQNKSNTDNKLIEFLSNWLIQHVTEEDRKYAI
ncbi:MAG: bacteriohemerythrin [Deltaproteobacteria bacterium]